MALADSVVADWARPVATKLAIVTVPAHFKMIITNLMDGSDRFGLR
jgi:hypothetical protein